MAEYESENYWEPESRTLLSVLEQEPLPVVVKVCEGVYNSSEATTFSNGDLLKVDKYEVIEKVRARVAKRPAFNVQNVYQSVGEEFTIPLDYSSPVGLVPDMGDGRVVTLIDDLEKCNATWVRVLKDVTYWYQNKELQLHRGDKLQILNFDRGNLSCRRERTTLTIPRSVNGEFEVPCDPEVYTIKRIVQSLAFPQTVYFVETDQQGFSGSAKAALSNMEQFSGQVVLLGRLTERIAIGHFKGTGEDSDNYSRRTGIILPLDNTDIAQLEVQLPLYMDTSDYQMFQLQHFSQGSADTENQEGALYIEFHRVTMPHFFSYSHGKKESAPPRPYKPPTSPDASKSPTTHISLLHSATHNPRKPRPFPKPVICPPVPGDPPPDGRPEASVSPSRSLPPLPVSDNTLPRMSGTPERAKEQSSLRKRPPKPKPRSPPNSSHSHDDRIKISHGIKPFTTGSSKEDKNFTLADCFGGSSMQDLSDPSQKNEKSISTLGKIKNLGKRFRSKQPNPSQSSTGGSEEGDSDDNYEEIPDDDYLQPQGKGGQSKQQAPGAKINPLVAKVIPTSWVPPSPSIGQDQAAKAAAMEKFKKLSVNDLATVLQECGFPELGKITLTEKLDGQFLVTLQEKDLSEKPFSLSAFQITKLDKVIGGWRPQTD